MLRRQLTTGTSGWITGEASHIGNTSAVGPSINGVDPLIKKKEPCLSCAISSVAEGTEHKWK